MRESSHLQRQRYHAHLLPLWHFRCWCLLNYEMKLIDTFNTHLMSVCSISDSDFSHTGNMLIWEKTKCVYGNCSWQLICFVCYLWPALSHYLSQAIVFSISRNSPLLFLSPSASVLLLQMSHNQLNGVMSVITHNSHREPKSRIKLFILLTPSVFFMYNEYY